MRTDPWTRRLTVSWPPSLAFLEHRYEILRALDKETTLRQLRVTEDHVLVQLGDANHRLGFGLTRMEAMLLQPDADIERIRTALRLVLEGLSPRRLTRPNLTFQWLLEIDGDYKEARTSTALAGFREAGVSVDDWSILVDGTLQDPALTYQLECGIVDSAEAPQRLARQVGRLLGGPSQTLAQARTSPSLWPSQSLPGVAFFADVGCVSSERPEPSMDSLTNLWQGVETAMKDLVLRFAKLLEVVDE